MTQHDDSDSASWLSKLAHSFSTEPSNKKELLQILKDAVKRNLIDDEALEMIQGVMNVSDMQVRDIMIPRAQIALVEKDNSLDDILTTVVEASHSRFPVIGDRQDDVVGILLAKDLLRHFTNPSQTFDISQYLRPAHFVPESKRLDVLLHEFRESRNHMAIVIDEYGGIAGVVTIEDVIEEIVGDIEDEFDDEHQPAIKPLDDHKYQVGAQTMLEDINQYFGTHFSDEQFDTIGGMVMSQFGRVPSVNESTKLGKLEITVTQADQRRLVQLQVTVTAP